MNQTKFTVTLSLDIHAAPTLRVTLQRNSVALPVTTVMDVKLFGASGVAP